MIAALVAMVLFIIAAITVPSPHTSNPLFWLFLGLAALALHFSGLIERLSS